MCGLVGVFGPALSYKERAAFKWLLHLDVVRGPHSTGILAVHDKQQTEVFKHLRTPEYLYDYYIKEFTDEGVYNYVDTILLLGHNRYATQGAISVENAHPFQFSNVIGAHNGTVDRWELNKFYEADKFDIDSQIIYSQINHSDNLQTIFDEIWSGAFALTWWDQKKQSFNMVRNDQRPLHYCYSHRGVLFWASKPWMLQVALGQCGVGYKEIKELKVNTHKAFTLNDKNTIQEKEVELQARSFRIGVGQSDLWYPATKEKKEIQFTLTEFHKHGETELGEPWGKFVGTTQDGQGVIVHIHRGNLKYYDIIKSWPTWATADIGTYIFNGAINVQPEKMYRPVEREFILTEEGETIFRDEYESCKCENCSNPLSWAHREETKVFAQDFAICHECVDLPLVREYIKELSQ